MAIAAPIFNRQISRDELYITLHRLETQKNTVPVWIADVGRTNLAAMQELNAFAERFAFVQIVGSDKLAEDRRIIKVGYEAH